MRYLILADTHFTDSPRDAYRFGIFSWLAKQQERYKTHATFILGDLCDRKDYHSAVLVNRITGGIIDLRPPVFILKGNHDYTDPANPFFRFLSFIDGVTFVDEPIFVPEYGGVSMIPHCRDQAEFDKACEIIAPRSTVMLHGCFDGAISETSGRRLSGLSLALVEIAKPRAIYAGDIHKPQRVGPLTYVGAPYHVRFGDDYTPRALLVDNGKEKDLHFPAPRKLMLEVSDVSNISRVFQGCCHEADQVKVRVRLNREEVAHWAKHRQAVLDACRARGLDVHGISLTVDATPQRQVTTGKKRTNKEVLEAYCKAEDLPDTLAASGAKLLNV